ncbi:twin-arginine translocase TatA/TatE family subunit [Porifericola rhodea]|uniref:Sec-independent protein translocase subunit TatA/TatB n=1 Tax=Porifericola rhodea TaxID=930972 RepID=UPI0026653E9C|nr:twin-arginine translocase TatA/TatE family subunit [Porifericola rhodea]WKN32694.1 twin-arginine translocase TatA/TatE family subunit [Porifericola rhodea]
MTLTFLMLENISGWELFIIVLVIYLFFGPRSLPKFYQSLKKTLSQFQESWKEVQRELHRK